MKQCVKCKLYKKLSEFYHNRKICKSCRAKQQKVYYINNQHKILSQKKRYYKCNRKIILRKAKNLNPWEKTYRAIKGRCEHITNGCYIKYGAKGIKCLITKEELKTLWFRDKAYCLKRPSIDRINSKGNYIFENCRYIELGQNTAKGNIERSKKP